MGYSSLKKLTQRILYAKANISAKKTKTRENSWVSISHEDKERKKRDQTEKSQGKKKANCFLDAPQNIPSLKKE